MFFKDRKSCDVELLTKDAKEGRHETVTVQSKTKQLMTRTHVKHHHATSLKVHLTFPNIIKLKCKI